MKEEEINKLFLGGKSLKDLNFPEDWEYDRNLAIWKSEKHFVMVTEGLSKLETGRNWGEPKKKYLYITDEQLANIIWDSPYEKDK